MQGSPKQSPGHTGLRCRKCGSQQFRVVYTRAARDGKIVRRRECRQCGGRITTWERTIGG
jgi:transcriptional regulator NrdR family protein